MGTREALVGFCPVVQLVGHEILDLGILVRVQTGQPLLSLGIQSER